MEGVPRDIFPAQRKGTLNAPSTAVFHCAEKVTPDRNSEVDKTRLER